MYTLKNGILYENDKPVFCVGLSYYPSYHEKKVPVPADGDRIGEMKKDIRLMKEAGFNLFRMASIGDVKRINGQLEINTQFVDMMLDEADNVGIAMMVRLQVYSMNFSEYDDFYMINQHGEQMDSDIWWDFIQNSLFHEDILRDNDEGMDIVVITHYINTNGAPCFDACLVLDNAESAAAINNKHCWLVEYDARTNVPLRKFYEETYMAIILIIYEMISAFFIFPFLCLLRINF